jgi:Na+/H+-dicarboxylate symporter
MGASGPRVSGSGRASFTTRSLIGLGAGFALGALAHAAELSALQQAAQSLEPIGTLWVNALRMIVIPLVLSNLVLGMADHDGGRGLGRLGAWSFGLFAAFLLAGTALTLLLAPPALRFFPFEPGAFARVAPPVVGAARAAEGAGGFSLLQWLLGLVPVNPFEAAAEGAILPLLVFTVLVALALPHAAPATRAALLPFVRGVSDVMFVLLRWILKPTPYAVFVLALAIGARGGGGIVGAVGLFIVLVCALMTLYLLLLYPLTALASGVGPGRFARAVAPAQTVAVGTRSSLASLPALIQGAEGGLGMPRPVSGFVLPLSVATFKVNTSISSVTKFLFLAAAYGIDLDLPRVVTFVVASLMLSFGSPGVPTAPGSVTRLPAYLAAGIPLEGVVLLSAVDAVPDIFKTLLNVTADMSVATIVARWGAPAPVMAAAVEPVVPAAGEG